MSELPRVVLLPGMGASAAMFPAVWHELGFVEFWEWPPGSFGSLGSLADALLSTRSLSSEDVIGGTSLGGMVAQELAVRAGCRGVILLGSARRGDEVAFLLRKAKALAAKLPLQVAQLSAPLAGELGRQFAQSDPDFLVSMCRVAPEWSGVELPCPVLRLHGDRDHVIPAPEDDAILVPGAGHLLAATHAEALIAHLLPWLRALPPSSATRGG